MTSVSDDDDNVSYEVRADINDILKMVRKFVKLFKKYPVKNLILQGHIKSNHGKDRSLILDCKTRWSSTEHMIERYNLVHDSNPFDFV